MTRAPSPFSSLLAVSADHRRSVQPRCAMNEPEERPRSAPRRSTSLGDALEQLSPDLWADHVVHASR